MIRSQRGFSMIELMVVLVVIGTLLRIALPNYASIVRKARAAQAVADMNAVRDAAFSYYTQNTAWPKEYAAGQIPAELVSHLPAKFTFTRPTYSLDWEYWILPTGLPSNPASKVLLGVSISTTDQALGSQVMSVLSRGNATFTSGSNYTLVIATTGDSP